MRAIAWHRSLRGRPAGRVAELRKNLGVYDKLGKEIAARIPNAKLLTFEDLGHSPQIQAPERFHEALLKGLAQ